MLGAVFTTLDDLRQSIGREIASGEWCPVTQKHTFAEATGDRQWIHVDRERAQRKSTCGTAIAPRVPDSFVD